MIHSFSLFFSFETLQCYDVPLILMEEQTSFSLFIYIFFAVTLTRAVIVIQLMKKREGETATSDSLTEMKSSVISTELHVADGVFII